MIAAKFGGSSLANAQQFIKVRDIVQMNPERRYIVPSAPGKRYATDDKITDLLYSCHAHAEKGLDFKPIYDRVSQRICEIANDLSIKTDLGNELEQTYEAIRLGASRAYTASRGEYFSGILLANFLGMPFVDACDVVRFKCSNRLDEEKTNELLSQTLKNLQSAVIPGFYGADENGEIHTFSRGGSDISGALVARAVNADLYENWTDVNGFLMADPRIVKDAQYIANITYRELRELSYMGATVLHEDAVFPVRRAGIPTNIRNTNDPGHPGTLIHYAAEHEGSAPLITGIAGRKGFCIVSIEKDMMNAELGFGRRVLQAVEECGISFEHLPTGIDTMCVVISQEEIATHREKLIRRIQELTNPDKITIHDHLALVATVGRGMVRTHGIAARLFSAISSQGISIRTIDQGSSELNIIVGVDEEDFERTVRAIYNAFVGT
jgi:aspartate kinase